MLGKFWEVVGGKLADRWATVAVPALAFWLSGMLAWAYHSGSLYQLTILTGWLDRQTTAIQIVVFFTVLLAVAASGVLVDQLTTPGLQLLKGYWPSRLGWLRRRLTAQVEQRAAADTLQ